MGQKCPICRRIVSTDGHDAGSTVVCPGCGTGIVVEYSQNVQSGGRPPAQGGAGQAPIGSYSLKFDGTQLRQESIFGADYLNRPFADQGQPPGVNPRQSNQEQPSAPRQKVIDNPAVDAAVSTPRQPIAQVRPPAVDEPSFERPPERMDPDATIGFGGDTDFLAGLDRKDPFQAEPPVSHPSSAHDYDDLLFEAGQPAGHVVPPEDKPSEGFDDWLMQEPGVAGAETVKQKSLSEEMLESPFDIDSGDSAQYAPTEKFDQDLSAALGEDDFIAGLDDEGTPAYEEMPLIDEVDYETPPDEAAPLKVSETRKMKRSRAAVQKRQRPVREKTGKRRRDLGPVLIVPVVLLLVGAVLGQSDYGYFGINLIRGNVGASDSYYRTIENAVQMVGDSRAAFLENIRRLEKAYTSDDSVENMTALLNALNRFRERYPDAFASDPGLGARLNDLRAVAARKDSSAAGMTQVTELMGQGKYSEARAVLDNMMAQTAQDVDALYYYGKIALGQGKAEEAQKYFELALIRNPGMLSARYFLAESYAAQNKLLEAKVILGEIASNDAKHLPSRVLSARIALTELNYDEAARLAREVITLGLPGPDTEDVFQAHRILARVHEAGGNSADQLSELKAALELKPADETTAIEAGRLMIAQNKRSEAVDLLKPCRESGCLTEDFLLVFAEACYMEDKTDLAETAVAQGVEKYPQSPRFGVLVGRHHLAQNRVRSAIDALQGAIRIDPSYTDAYELLADALRREGKLQDAARALVDGMNVVGQKPHLLTILASIQMESKDLSGAETSLRKAVELDPDSDEAQLRLGMLIKAQGRNDEAAAILNVLEKKKALDFDGTIALADAYLSVGDTQRARDILEKLAADNPDRPEAWNAWGRALGVARQFDKAVDILSKVRARFPNDGRTNFYLGEVYMSARDWNNAISFFTDAVKIEGENNIYRLALARAQLALGTVDGETEARKQLDFIAGAYAAGSVPVEDQDAEVYLLRGRILFAREKFSQAMKDFEDALRLAPTRRDIMVDFGKSLYEMARYDDAAPYFKQVLAADSQNPDANYFLGRIALRAGDGDAATGYLVDSVKRSPGKYPEAHRLLGLIYKDKGLRTLARDSFRAYLKYTPDRKTTEAVEVQRMLEKETY